MKIDLKTDRRTFMRRGAMGLGALWTCSLGEFGARAAHRAPALGAPSPYGPLRPRPDQTTGLPLLQLPEGFRYWSYSWRGDVMADGVVCPPSHDGMAVVDAWHDPGTPGGDDRRGANDQGGRRDGKLVLIRNHEGGNGAPYVPGRPDITYVPSEGRPGAGGTTNLIFDAREGKWESAWSSLAGTMRNCAGGVTPWGTWLTCEETAEPGHGWIFDVSPEGADPSPLFDMGRFSHEAVMVDPGTGFVYETEDSGNAGLYRFVPNRKHRLERGGQLFMLAVTKQPNFDFGAGHKIGTKWPVSWVRVDDPLAKISSCFAQGAAKGAARFSRLEGAWWGHRTGYFISTSGGGVKEGQVFEYDPNEETVTLIYEAPDAIAMDYPDNVTVTPRGGLLLCEDSGGKSGAEGERLMGLTLHGQTFPFAMNNINLTTAYSAAVAAGDYRQQEWAGACYSPDGNWLFANIQTPGVTFAITGPWGKGPL